MQIEKANPKMGFGGPNMALANMGFKDQKLVSFWRGGNRRERERGEENREEEEEEEEDEGEKFKQSQIKVWNFEFCMETNLDYGFYEIWHGSLGLYDDYLAQT